MHEDYNTGETYLEGLTELGTVKQALEWLAAAKELPASIDTALVRAAADLLSKYSLTFGNLETGAVTDLVGPDDELVVADREDTIFHALVVAVQHHPDELVRHSAQSMVNEVGGGY